MAKGLLFALVRRGSKLNYLDDGNMPSEHERKLKHEKDKSRFKVKSQKRVIEVKTTEICSTEHQREEVKVESKRTRKKLFDLTLQKLSKGSRTNRSSPDCSNNNASTEDSFTGKRRGRPKSDYLSKVTWVPSVASGYFVHEVSASNSKEPTSKKQENGSHMPRIVLTDHDAGNSTTDKSVERNIPRMPYSRYSSLPQLRVDESRKRPCSWTGGVSSPQLNDFTNRRSRTSSMETEPNYSNSNQIKISGLCVEAIPIAASPSTSRRNLGSANSLRSQGRQLNRPDSLVESRGNCVTKSDNSLSVDTKDHFVKRASSWSRGDEKVSDFKERQHAKKIDIFLPTV